ncbi:ATP-binding cassette domain-containing protein [Halorhabdus amylolytica]|uniref:hypothetical protein n=1 Tax=Halorhabdus amylolytica TaxID=2559573 RepID=UPI0010AAD6AE|nr:hypothetical protein [Halorhabdus amylolytica]
MLLGEPTVLFLDEPTTGLDPTAAKSLRMQLDDLAAEGRTLCYSTHNRYEAEFLADELTIVQDGVVLAKGPNEELLSRLKEGDTRAIHVVADAHQADFESIGVSLLAVAVGWVTVRRWLDVKKLL